MTVREMTDMIRLGGGSGGGGSAGVEIIELGAQASAMLVRALMRIETALAPGSAQPDAALMFELDGDFSGALSAAIDALERGKTPVFLVEATEGMDYPMSLIPTSVSLALPAGITFNTSFSDSIPDGEGGTVYHTWLFTVIVLADQARLIGRRLDADSY
ncbi:MAG: hypothetical protein E7423_01975 [Ruminococcaceae bacterium]|nr:hypothetical protein [Oscillospiraceae bacterium]